MARPLANRGAARTVARVTGAGGNPVGREIIPGRHYLLGTLIIN
jgi:hypothetical protein